MDKEETAASLTTRQRRFVGLVLCFAAAVLFFLLLGFVTWGFAKALVFFSGVIWPLAMAGILSIMLRPVVGFFDTNLNLGSIPSILLLYFLVLAVAGSAVWLVGGKVVEQVGEFNKDAKNWPDRIEAKAKDWLPEKTWLEMSGEFEAFKETWADFFADGTPDHFTAEEREFFLSLKSGQRDVFRKLEENERVICLQKKSKKERDEYLVKMGKELKAQARETANQHGEKFKGKATAAIKSAGAILLSFFTKLTYLAVIPIYLFYFLSSKYNLLESLEKEMTFLSAGLRADIVFLIREFVGILVAFFRGQLLIGVLMGVGYAIGFYFSGLKGGLALGLIFGFMNIVPYLGSIIGILITLLVAYLQPNGISESGSWGILAGCGITFVIVQLIESYLLTPRIMGHQTGLHPVIVIVAIFFWGTALGGILGMIFGIPLTAFIIIAWRLLRRKYLNNHSPSTETSSANA